MVTGSGNRLATMSLATNLSYYPVNGFWGQITIWRREWHFESSLEPTFRDLKSTDGALKTSKYPVVRVK